MLFEQGTFMFVICSEDGTILYADSRLSTEDFKRGTVLQGFSGHRQPAAGEFKIVQTKNGLLELCYVETEFFKGYIGVMCNAELRDLVINKLEEINKELEAIFESSHDGIVVADENGVFIRINSSYERITGIPREEIIGKTAQSIVEKGLVSDSVTIHVLKTGQSHTFSQTFRSGRQSVITGSPVFDSNNRIIRVVTNVRDMTEINRLKEELAESQKKLTQYSQIVETMTEEQMFNEKLIFRSRKMEVVRDSAIKFAKVDAPLLITGESGVGKEVIADLVYRYSPRKGLPFLKINCGAIPETLLESELFGYEGGAFTGAKKEGRTGLFEMANGGTVMLDEIGELPLALQVKLLRFVQQKEFYRVGGKKVVKVDVRLIAATNRDLQEMVNQKQFRSDLFYRLNVLRIHIPPLRERPEDIIPLVNYLLDKYNKKYNVSKRISGDVYHAFTNYTWVGNVRELENLIERLVVICDRDEITLDYLPDEMKKAIYVWRDDSIGREQTYKEAKEEFEREFFCRALEKYKSSRQAAEKLGLDHSTIVKKAAKYGIKLLSRSRTFSGES
ncbi:putative PAS/PAC sensor protein [Thermosinus carboxydivorans Nor1]|uniref:HTH-type transcriptional regulatory protein TyrR n=1 Tax=Thermosinus carboxydivorans Nor1 TaxID=401526 RepID=A1HSG4_9FIRM|nr:sigma 54-interacting transcriptional regulator [Thermosinus carboxydivorans]EAX47028.1 putative PAS/PAC sensor protein [Thermosinus carboxydivorans Nor1]